MELTTLQDYIENHKKEWDKENEGLAYHRDIGFEDETLLWLIQDWNSMFGGLTGDEYEYLNEVWGLTAYDVDELLKED